MGASTFENHAVEQLQRLGAQNDLSFFFGAGSSMASGLPGWRELIVRLLSQDDDGSDSRRVAEALVDSQGLLLAGEAALADASDPTQRKQRVDLALFGNEVANPRQAYFPSGIHNAVAGVANERRGQPLSLFTTNYDDLIEQALRAAGIPVTQRWEASYPEHLGGGLMVQHLHGLLGSDPEWTESEDVVLTASDFERLWKEEDWVSAAIAEATNRGPIVFVGASMTDPNLMRYVTQLKPKKGSGGAGRKERRKPVAVFARQGLGVPFPLAARFEKVLRAQWHSLGVEAVILEDFADVSQFIRELPRAHQANYLAPGERARQLWSVLERDFKTLQPDFSQRLHEDFSSVVKPRLAGDDAGLDLWVTDGQGSIVRYAISDRLYRDSAGLRRIPYRSDVGWVVAEAMCSGQATLSPLRVERLSEPAVSGQRWRCVGAIALQVELYDHPPLTVACLSAPTTAEVGEIDKGDWLEGLESLKANWEQRLSELAAAALQE